MFYSSSVSRGFIISCFQYTYGIDNTDHTIKTCSWGRAIKEERISIVDPYLKIWGLLSVTIDDRTCTKESSHQSIPTVQGSIPTKIQLYLGRYIRMECMVVHTLLWLQNDFEDRNGILKIVRLRPITSVSIPSYQLYHRRSHLRYSE
jgi:hypothetical protein